jgi:L-ascorbate metabolism protein UlaG (beta-lactamase superfamily)
MKLTYYGHSCFAIEINNATLLFDPFITGNTLAKDVDIDSIKADYILVSHAHFDHIQDVEQIAKKNNSKLITCWEIFHHYQAKGIDGFPMNIGGTWEFEFGTVTMVQALHSSSFPDGSYGGLAAGFVITHNGKSIYYAGDTALFGDMKLLGEMHKIDWAILPIGDKFTMDAKQALMSAQMMNCKNVMAVHFDTFEPIKVDHEKTKELFKSNNINFVLPTIGEEISL